MDRRTSDPLYYRKSLERGRRAREKSRRRRRKGKSGKRRTRAGLLLLFALLIGLSIATVVMAKGRTETGDSDRLAVMYKMMEPVNISGETRLSKLEAGMMEAGMIFAAQIVPGDWGPETAGEEAAAEGENPAFGYGGADPAVPLIAVDAGHGGEDEGSSREGVLEKDVNLAIAERLRDRLETMGYEVMMVREGDTFQPKEERAKAANTSRASAYVSIHQNTWEDTDARGIETWYYGEDQSRDSGSLARLVHQETVKCSGARGRELRDDAGFVVTGQTAMPSCLIETGFLSNPQERTELTDPEYQEKLAKGIARGIDLYFHPRTMYLTFDDGPSEENTSAVLDILKARNIKATFFVVGENVRKHPEVARRIVEEGHTIGIHCNRHDYEALYKSVDSYLADFQEAYSTVQEVTGAEVKLYRFPGGSINAYNRKVYKEIIAEMDSRGFVYFDWNASLDDALKKSSPQELIQNARDSLLDRKQVVLLAHDIVHSTAQCLDGLIDQLPEYRMEPLTPEVEAVQFRE